VAVAVCRRERYGRAGLHAGLPQAGLYGWATNASASATTASSRASGPTTTASPSPPSRSNRSRPLRTLGRTAADRRHRT